MLGSSPQGLAHEAVATLTLRGQQTNTQQKTHSKKHTANPSGSLAVTSAPKHSSLALQIVAFPIA